MINKFNKSISIFLAVLLLYSSCGSWLVLKLQQQLNYFQVEKQLKNIENLNVLTFSHLDYEKSKTNDFEILLNGKMYDIKQTIRTKDSVSIYCIADEKEDGLIVSYISVEKNKSHKTGHDSQTLKFFSLIYIQSKQVITPYHADNIKLDFALYSSFFKPAVIQIESPPPKA